METSEEIKNSSKSNSYDNRLTVRAPDRVKEVVYAECFIVDISYQRFILNLIVDHFIRKYGINPMVDPDGLHKKIREARNV